jgi:hypothetical protein
VKTERQRLPVTRFRTVYPLFAGLAAGFGSVSAAGPCGVPDRPGIESSLDGQSTEHDPDDTGVESTSDSPGAGSTTGVAVTHVCRGGSRGDGGG